MAQKRYVSPKLLWTANSAGLSLERCLISSRRRPNNSGMTSVAKKWKHLLKVIRTINPLPRPSHKMAEGSDWGSSSYEKI